jgi:hypothetical protein
MNQILSIFAVNSLVQFFSVDIRHQSGLLIGVENRHQ